MNILYEEDGSFKVGSLMADNITSLQVEGVSGKRSKIKATSLMLRFTEIPLDLFIAQAEALAAGIEVDFLWECCPPDEFGFGEISAEYFGHAPNPLEAAATLFCLHSAPIYFHRKGRGRFRAAPPEVLKAALLGAEKKRLQQALQARYTEQLCRFELPAEFAGRLGALLYKPDRNTLEVKALEAACAASGLSAAHLMQCCGALSSTHDYHLHQFLAEQFPHGTDFPQVELCAFADLPLASAGAFSIDDATTTEIDDAFSVEQMDNGNWRIGVHIAVPALGMQRDSSGDKIAAQRLSTVYMPGRKITMLPEDAVQAFTLCADRVCPALSMYNEVDWQTLAIVSCESRVERIHVAANLRHETLEPLFNEQTLAQAKLDYPFAAELALLWRLVLKLEEKRGKPSDAQQVDYNFAIIDDRVSITQRRRGSPIDKVVSELMILVNSEWGRLLALHGFSGIYRTQNNGKVKMSTVAAPHQGLGVAQYMWSSSPLRRYVDMVNQRQIIAMVQGAEPSYTKNDNALYIAMRDFDVTYTLYNDFQRNMERYWCLRWLEQEGAQDSSAGEAPGELIVTATVLRENLVKLLDIPLVFRAPSLPEVPPGTKVRLAIVQVDLLDLEVRGRYVATVEEEVPVC